MSATYANSRVPAWPTVENDSPSPAPPALPPAMDTSCGSFWDPPQETAHRCPLPPPAPVYLWVSSRTADRHQGRAWTGAAAGALPAGGALTLGLCRLQPSSHRPIQKRKYLQLLKQAALPQGRGGPRAAASHPKTF